MIKRILLTVVILSMSVICLTAQDYERRYNLLVSQVGPAGVGVETLLDNWARAEKDNDKMLTARFHYYLLKSQSSEIVTRPERKYLGTEPVLTLKDSTGADVYYFEVLKYDDELFREAVAAVDWAIEVYPDRLQLRFMKINAYVSYERESPDMALANLIALASDFMPPGSFFVFTTQSPSPALSLFLAPNHPSSRTSISTPRFFALSASETIFWRLKLNIIASQLLITIGRSAFLCLPLTILLLTKLCIF